MWSVITPWHAIISVGPLTHLVHGSTGAPLMSRASQYFISAPLLIVWLYHIYQHCLNIVLRTDLLNSSLTFKPHSLFPQICVERPFDLHISTAMTGWEPANFIVGNWSTKRWRSKRFANFGCPVGDLWDLNFFRVLSIKWHWVCAVHPSCCRQLHLCISTDHTWGCWVAYPENVATEWGQQLLWLTNGFGSPSAFAWQKDRRATWIILSTFVAFKAIKTKRCRTSTSAMHCPHNYEHEMSLKKTWV